MSHISLYQFITTISRMLGDGQDFGEENTVSPDDDILRVMTIHASKGLEFEYVIYAGIHRNLNFRDLQSRVIVHADYGIGCRQFRPEHNTILPSIHTTVMQEYIKKETISEEMRLIYVAMTRAVEQLIIPVVFKKEEKQKYLYSGGMVLADHRLNITSVQELLYPILKYLNDEDFDFIKMDNAAIEDDEEEETRHHLTLDMLEEVDAGRSESLSDRFNRSEEHTSELQSRGHLVCRLLLEKKKKNKRTMYRT